MLRTTALLGISMVEQKSRQRLVTILYSLLLAGILATIVMFSAWHGRYSQLVVNVCFLVPLSAGWKIFRDMVGDMVLETQHAKLTSLGLSTRRDPDEPDERDIMVRNAAYFKAYRVLAWYTVLGSIAVAPFLGTKRAALPLGLLCVLLVIASTLPQAILLWTEPDVPLEPI